MFFLLYGILDICISFIIIQLLFKALNYYRKLKYDSSKLHVAFFHPYCNAGGGGERVLWSAIKGYQDRYSCLKIYIYSAEPVPPEDILGKVKARFGITLKESPIFIKLSLHKLLDAKMYPVATLLLQSLVSIIVGLEAYFKLCPGIYIDTIGFTFTNVVFKYLADASIVSYTHYPIISLDMIEKVSSHDEAHNNRSIIAKSSLLSSFKLYYYKLFAIIYGFFGRMTDVVMVNSNWTKNHILSLWKCYSKLHLVYPPCDLESFSKLQKTTDSTILKIISIGQFRPEKNYPLQLQAFKILLETSKDFELVLIGGVRNAEDEQRVEELKELAENLNISHKVKWLVNAPFDVLLNEVKEGTIGLHSMWNEHFGISVVECMAGGLVMVAHDSGGPKLDIINVKCDQRNGYLASTNEMYAETMANISRMCQEERNAITDKARKSSQRFGQNIFIDNFIQATENIFNEKIVTLKT